MKKRRYTDKELAEAVKDSFSWGAVIRKLGLCEAGGTYAHIQRLSGQLGLDSSHFLGMAWNKNRKFPQQVARRLEEYLVLEGPSITTVKLKERLWLACLKKRECEICGITTWQGHPAPLELHHRDQNPKNNRLENLTIVCANCHALVRVIYTK